MATVKITDLTAYSDPKSTDVLPIVDVTNDITKKVDIAGILKNAPAGSASATAFAFDGDPNTGIYSPGADQIALATGGTGRVFVDASGNVGIGTSSTSVGYGRELLLCNDPVAGISGFGVRNLAVNSNQLYIQNNAQNTGAFSDQYRNSNIATRYIQDVQGHKWFVSSSGTPGSTISWQEYLRIDSSGNVGIGTSSPGYKLHTAGAGSVIVASQGTTDASFLTNLNGTQSLYIHSVADLSEINELRNVPIRFNTNSTERLRIDSSGRLLVGTSSNSGGSLLQVNDDRIRIASSKTPASATATGTAGEICWDASYIYVCTTSNTWKRAALSSW